jgi:hypothetical protein
MSRRVVLPALAVEMREHIFSSHSREEACMAQPERQVTMKRVFIWLLILVLAIWIAYVLMGGFSRPQPST